MVRYLILAPLVATVPAAVAAQAPAFIPAPPEPSDLTPVAESADQRTSITTIPASATLPDPVRGLIAQAIADGDPAAIAAVVRIAKKVYPENAAAIEAATAEHEAAVAAKRVADERERLARLANRNPLVNWKGEIELGASRSTGNTRNLGLYGSFKAEREGLNWRHKVIARADLQETNSITTTERVTASWQPNYKFDDRLYAYGILQYEHDRFLGYSDRYTGGGGIGYRVVAEPKMQLDLEGGPALRHTNLIDGTSDSAIAGRASLAFRWTISPTLQLAQDAALYLEPGNNNATSTTSLDTKLLGALKARFSYNVQYERDAPTARETIDTLSRATLVYSF